VKAKITKTVDALIANSLKPGANTCWKKVPFPKRPTYRKDATTQYRTEALIPAAII
jgi:hypothetical protein